MKSIIEMAKQAGFGIDESPCVLQPYVIQPLHGKIDDELTRFANLVRADDEALLRQALEALEWAGMNLAWNATGWGKARPAINAIRARIGEKT
jgi:hypothetical protein